MTISLTRARRFDRERAERLIRRNCRKYGIREVPALIAALCSGGGQVEVTLTPTGTMDGRFPCLVCGEAVHRDEDQHHACVWRDKRRRR